MSAAPRWVRLLVGLTTAAYRLALRRYPKALRARYGARMVADARSLVLDELRRAGLAGWLRACGRLGRDLLRPLPPRLERASSQVGPVGRGTRRESRWESRWRAHATRGLGDLAGAWRSLRRRPGFSLLLVGVLGVGLALNATIFAVVDAYLLRPLPYPDADRLVDVRPASDAIDWTRSDDVFEKAVSWRLDGFTLVGDGAPEIVLGAYVSPDFFDAWGVRPALGRFFGAGEAGEGGPPVAVISHALWTRRFAADPGVLGRTVQVYPADQDDGLESFTIVGVLPRDFWYLNGYTNVLVPLRGPGPVYVGRLRSDVPPERAAEVLTARAREAAALEPGESVGVRPLQSAYTASIRPQLLALQGAGILVLLAATASAALLLLVRASGRSREMSVRRALGAGRGRLALHLFSEALILAGGAGALGGALAWGGLGALGGLIEARLGRRVPGGTAALHLDGSVIATSLAVVTLLALVLGSVAVAMAARRGIAARLAEGGRGGATGGVLRARGTLVATQVALCVALLSGGALLVRSALHVHGMQLGFDPEGLEAYNVGLTTERADDVVERAAFFEELLRRAEALPAVTSAGLVRAVPHTGALTARAVEVEGRAAADPLPEVVPQVASPGYFATLGVERTRGRLFTEDDGPGTTPVAVVDAMLAAAIAPPGSGPGAAVGARIRFTAWTMPEMELEPGPWTTVVGVVPDVADGIGGARPTLYVPYAQAPSAWMDLVLRTRPGTPGLGLAAEVRAIVHDLDANTPLYAEKDVAGAIRRARAPARFFAALLGGFSLFSLGLALVGLYGVAAYAAHQRRRDLAVRLALGATRGSVAWLFVRGAAFTITAGVAVGLLGARALGGALRPQLHGVGAHDPATLAAVAAVVAATALLAVWIPARGAARLELSRILRDE